jgi:putative two-component system response regulator
MKDKPVILVVDDQVQNIELLEAHLVPQGYEIIRAVNGEDALDKLSGNQIDLILLDIMMPGMDGFEVTRRVRQSIKKPFASGNLSYSVMGNGRPNKRN